MRVAATTAILASALGFVRACNVVNGVSVTFYGWGDNDPPGDATAYNCGRNYHAGGTGTYSDPISMATADGLYNRCEVVYMPMLQKYVRMEDYCETCTRDWQNGVPHIDIWAGNSPESCEWDLTPDGGQSVVRDPPSNLPVNTTPLWDGRCRTDVTWPGASGSCGGGGSNPGGCQTGCSWAGHCLGCSCNTWDDCSDDYTCTNGVCANP